MPSDALDSALDRASGLPRKKWSGKKLVLFVVLPLLILIGAGAGLYVTGVFERLMGGDAAPEEVAEPQIDFTAPGHFFNLPDIIVNLNSGGARQSFLKLSVSLELNSAEDVPHVEQVMPRIIDNFQVYLRELSVDDLRGSAGLYRLREELLRRVNQGARPAVVRDVLFREMLVQ